MVGKTKTSGKSKTVGGATSHVCVIAFLYVRGEEDDEAGVPHAYDYAVYAGDGG